MDFFFRRWCLVGATLGLTTLLLCPPARSDSKGEQPQASIDRLKTEAWDALKIGQFDLSNKLLGEAAEMSHDPAITQMADWTRKFESQRQEFVAERRKQYDKAVGDVKLLEDKGKGDYAIDAAARAFLLAADKKAFHEEPWVDALIKKTVDKARQYDQNEQWLKALRLYSDLGSVEPANPEWKERLKLATRRVRLLALYTPDALKALQESESKDREEVDALLHPSTQPSTQVAKEAAGEADSFRLDWHETLRGIRLDMLRDALQDAWKNYYRDVSYQKLAVGGLNGLQALATTKGLEKAFPKLGDADKRISFLRTVDELMDKAKDAKGPSEQYVLQSTLAHLETANADTVQLPREVLVSEFADGAFGELDPFSSMIWPSDLEEFNKATQGEFSGVGIQIQSEEDGSLKVVSPLEDSPAYKAGIKAGDIITHINGKNAKGITLNQAVKSITGAKGTSVILTVRATDAKVRDHTIRRETIKVASIKGWLHRPGGGWEYFVDRDQKIGYLRMTNFTKDTAKELDSAIDQLESTGARALILDLRYNPGGLLNAATDVADKFLHDGVIVSTRPDRDTGNPATESRATNSQTDCNMELVVLVNQYSASASEIVSGALKDLHRARVVGERTFGKGSVQMLFPLNNHTAYLKLTTSHYYLPSGRCIHREENSTEWGVDPDVKVEMTPEQMRAAIDARQDLDVLRDASVPPAEGETPRLRDEPKGVEAAVAPKKDLLSSDPQLSAAVLLLRLKLAGAEL